MKRNVLGLIFAVVVFGVLGLWYLNQSRIFELKKIAGWESYKNEKLGFSVQYPSDWKVAEVVTEIDPITHDQPSGMEFAVFEEQGSAKEGITLLGKKVMVDNWITRWEIYPYYRGKSSLQETDVEILVSNIGREFKDRKEMRENVSVAGRTGLRVVVKSLSDPGLLEELIIVEANSRVYVIRNLDTKASNGNFKKFYESFRLEGFSGI